MSNFWFTFWKRLEKVENDLSTDYILIFTALTPLEQFKVYILQLNYMLQIQTLINNYGSFLALSVYLTHGYLAKYMNCCYMCCVHHL